MFKTVVLVVACLTSVSAWMTCPEAFARAQFPKVPKPESPRRESPGPSKITPQPPSSRPPLLYDKPLPPSLIYFTALKSLRVRENGEFILDGTLKAAFLPDREQGSDKQVYYGTHPSQHSLTFTLKTEAGGTVSEIPMSGLKENRENVFWTLQPVAKPFFQLPGEGRYVAQFSLDGKPFYLFPFTVKKISNADPYKPGDTFHLEGPWNDYGALSFEGSDKLVRWNMLLSKTYTSGDDNSIRVKVAIVKNGKVLGENDENLDITRVANMQWVPRTYVLAKAGRAPFPLKDLIAQDGPYEVVVTVNGKKSVYPFEVKAGEIQLSGRQARGGDPLRAIEGGGEHWFLRKKDAAYD